jgi:hypothetical protein
MESSMPFKTRLTNATTPNTILTLCGALTKLHASKTPSVVFLPPKRCAPNVRQHTAMEATIGSAVDSNARRSMVAMVQAEIFPVCMYKKSSATSLPELGYTNTLPVSQFFSVDLHSYLYNPLTGNLKQ